MLGWEETGSLGLRHGLSEPSRARQTRSCADTAGSLAYPSQQSGCGQHRPVVALGSSAPGGPWVTLAGAGVLVPRREGQGPHEPVILLITRRSYLLLGPLGARLLGDRWPPSHGGAGQPGQLAVGTLAGNGVKSAARDSDTESGHLSQPLPCALEGPYCRSPAPLSPAGVGPAPAWTHPPPQPQAA